MNQTQSEIVQKTAAMIKEKFTGEGSGHDWWHIYRVWQSAKNIASNEKADTYIVELGALLHDIADYKFNNGNEQAGGIASKIWLRSLGVEDSAIEKVVHIVDNVSFKGGTEKNKMKTLEGKIVQDADRLDGIGAIGIARCFAYGGHKGHEIYNPEIKPQLNMTKEEYKNHTGTQINHFYEKLLLLKELMNTKTGKEIAQKRHEFMESFLDEFYKEWDGSQ